MIIKNFYVIGKKNNQTSVSDEDRGFQNLVSVIIRLPSGSDFSVCMAMDIRKTLDSRCTNVAGSLGCCGV